MKFGDWRSLARRGLGELVRGKRWESENIFSSCENGGAGERLERKSLKSIFDIDKPKCGDSEVTR